jgi:hypothetical protein
MENNLMVNGKRYIRVSDEPVIGNLMIQENGEVVQAISLGHIERLKQAGAVVVKPIDNIGTLQMTAEEVTQAAKELDEEQDVERLLLIPKNTLTANTGNNVVREITEQEYSDNTGNPAMDMARNQPTDVNGYKKEHDLFSGL